MYNTCRYWKTRTGATIYLTDAEEWRPVEGWPYEVSSHGRVRRTEYSKGSEVGRVLKASPAVVGYPAVALCHKGATRRAYVHQLMAEVFLEGCGDTVNHKDGNKTNNHITNLEWLSRGDNVRHAFRTGLVDTKLSPQDAEDIRAARGCLTQKTLASLYGVTQAMVSLVQQGKAHAPK
jgi:hypothetical protein